MKDFTYDRFIGTRGIGVRSVTDSIGSIAFDGGDEYSRLIFIIDNGITYDILTGSTGFGMIDSVSEFVDWYNGTKYIMKTDPSINERLEMDNDPSYSGINRFSGYTSCCITNAIIKHANNLLKGIQDGTFTIPDRIISIVSKWNIDEDPKAYICNYLRMFADLELFPVISLTEKEKLRKDNYEKQAKTDTQTLMNAVEIVIRKIKEEMEDDDSTDELDSDYLPDSDDY